MRKGEEMGDNRISYADVEKLVKEGKKEKKGGKIKLEMVLS